MNTFLLDAGIGSTTTVLWLLLLILLVVILIEAVVMLLFRINKFGKAFLHSSVVNIASTLLGYLLINQLDSLGSEASRIGQWLIFYGATVLIEGLLMMLFYTNVPRGKLWLITVVMNLASYLFLFLISS